MKIPPTLFTVLLLPLALLGFTACDDEPEVAYPGGNSFGYQGPSSATTTPPQYGAPYGSGPGPVTDSREVTPSRDTSPGSNQSASADSGGNSSSTSTTSSTSATSNTPSYPKGIPVPGKPGFVMSPYTKPDQGYVDVRGYPPGMEVKDPYTGGVFLVP